ncbi:SGNH/GDSL hydrolase family protein [Pseudoduganella sp. SL102]|uniref:SGNH/GDSL hydrolase family protein n=1 Tax=Pseudoduganella sp. SL102 TaxID=2995154 RepID=UPI00248D09CF|nr:SGNH/GDSL hydrolase family protein [Pseudoduganella sp. SL102]WBS02445.1 SGNH/GDSL hydrolase family protein [Pseudoduganella sp. SL102]
MRHMKLALAVMAGAILAACGGNSGDPQPGAQVNKVKFASQVSFGDSLSDLGTYNVGGVKALGGGKYTINGDSTAANAALTGKNWTELMAAQFGLPAPCPAQTGLDGDAALGFSVPVTNHAECFSYAQGGARVTNPVGAGHKLTGSPLGALTVPVVTQVKNHLAKTGGKFKGDEVVFVMAGGNDVLVNLAQLSSAATAAGTAAGQQAFGTSLATQLAAGATNPATAGPAIGLAIATESARSGSTQASIVQAAVTAAVQAGNTKAPASLATIVEAATKAAGTAGAQAGADYVAAQAPAMVAALATAGAELATLVKSQILGNGAGYVVVNNLPDVASTPAGRARDANVRALIDKMVQAFNAQLVSALGSESKVVIVDVYAVSHDQATNPGPYGLTNVTEPACDLESPKNPLGSSLGCTAASLESGDVSHYSYADEVHPTPFNNLLLARFVSRSLVTKGWL